MSFAPAPTATIADVLTEALQNAIERRGQGSVLSMLQSFARASVMRTEDASHGLFVKMFYASTETASPCAKRRTGLSPLSTSSASTCCPPLSRETLLSMKPIPDLPASHQKFSVKNTFVDLQSDSDDSNGAMSAPGGMSCGKALVHCPTLPPTETFFYGDTLVETGVQTCGLPKSATATASVQTLVLPKPRKCKVNGRACQTDSADVGSSTGSVEPTHELAKLPDILEQSCQTDHSLMELSQMLDQLSAFSIGDDAAEMFDIGCVVEVICPFHSWDQTQIELKKGIKGRIVKFDGDGDAMIKFPSLGSVLGTSTSSLDLPCCWVRKLDFRKLRLLKRS